MLIFLGAETGDTETVIAVASQMRRASDTATSRKRGGGGGLRPALLLPFFSHGVYASPRHLRHTNPSVSLLLAAPEGDPGSEADRAVRERLCEDLRSREGSSGRHLRGCVNGTRAKLRSHGSEKLQGTHCPPWAGGGGREGRIFDHLMHAILHLPY